MPGPRGVVGPEGQEGMPGMDGIPGKDGSKGMPVRQKKKSRFYFAYLSMVPARTCIHWHVSIGCVIHDYIYDNGVHSGRARR